MWGSNHEAEVVRRSTVKRQYTFMLSCVIRVGVDEDQVFDVKKNNIFRRFRFRVCGAWCWGVEGGVGGDGGV